MASMVTIQPVDHDGDPGRAEHFDSFDAALASLAGRAGSCFVQAPSLTSEQALALSRFAAQANPELLVGVIACDRAPATFRGRSPRATGTQYIFDNSRRGISLPRASSILSGDGEAEGVAALSAPADVAYFFGHSNGVHADGAVRVLSNCRENPPSIDAVAPACFGGDACIFAPRVLAPRMLGARRIIALTCWGVRLDDLYERTTSVGHSILHLPELEAYLTTVRAVRASLSELSLFYFLVNLGLPFGGIANRVNRARIREGLDAEYLCFGNPLSAVERTVAEGTCERTGDGRLSARAAPSADASDFMCVLPPAAEHGGPGQILRLAGGAKVRAACIDGDRAYFSLAEASDRPAEITFGVERLSRLLDYDHLPGDLLRDMTPIGAFFQLAPGVTAESREAIRARSEALRTWLLDWPFFRHAPGDYLFDEELDAGEQELMGQIEGLSKATLLGYRDLVHRGGPGGAVASGSIWPRLGRLSGSLTWNCGYCHATIAEYRYEGTAQAFTRRVAYCDRCGIVRDCDVGDVVDTLEMPSSARLGDEVSLSVPAENTYAHAMPAYAMAFIQASPARETAESRPVRAVLPPNAREGLSLRVTPGFRHPGVYVLSACAVVGARLSMFRAHIRLTA